MEQRAAAVPEGCEAQSAVKPQLAFVTFFDSPPDERVSLKYSSEGKRKGGWIATWALAANSRGYWIQCGYDNTTTVLSRRLPATVTTCKVTYERKTQVGSGLPAVKHVACNEWNKWGRSQISGCRKSYSDSARVGNQIMPRAHCPRQGQGVTQAAARLREMPRVSPIGRLQRPRQLETGKEFSCPCPSVKGRSFTAPPLFPTRA